METLLPAGWKAPRGYAQGVVASGRTLFLAGQIGWDPRTERLVSPEFVPQFAAALDNVLALLAEAGAPPSQLVRLTVFVTDLAAYRAARRELGALWKARFGEHWPAMSLIQVAGLLEPGALVELEATAVLP